MVCIKVINNHLSDKELESLQVLVLEAGCAADELELVTSVPEPDPDCADEVILVLLTAAACVDQNLEKEFAKAQNGGRRVICVWPQVGTPAELPAGAKKYSYSVIPWSAEKLRVVIADDDVTCFEAPTGEPLPEVEVERNLCVDEIGKPK